MLNRVVGEIIKNLNNKEDITKLGSLVKKLDNYILNDKSIYEKTMKNPFKYTRPVKGNQGYKTHNFIVNEFITKHFPKTKLIVSCNTFSNDENKYNFDVGIFVDNVNVLDVSENTFKNISKCYRITSCGIKIKAENIKYEFKKLFNNDNKLYSSALKYDRNNIYYIDGKKGNNNELDVINSNIDHYNGTYYSDKHNIEYNEIKLVPIEGYYFICECENFDFLQIIKHVEHIPLQEYEEILNIDINENVW